VNLASAAPDLLNHLHRPSTTYKPDPLVVRGATVDSETCCFCADGTLLSKCENQEHWEKRLKDYRLGEDRAADVRMKNTDGSRTSRLVQMDKNPDTIVVGPIVLPGDPDLREVFAMESLGVRYQHEPKRFWPNPAAPLGSTYIKSGRMGLEYGQAMPND
jgi:hypothetical protein